MQRAPYSWASIGSSYTQKWSRFLPVICNVSLLGVQSSLGPIKALILKNMHILTITYMTITNRGTKGLVLYKSAWWVWWCRRWSHWMWRIWRERVHTAFSPKGVTYKYKRDKLLFWSQDEVMRLESSEEERSHDESGVEQSPTRYKTTGKQELSPLSRKAPTKGIRLHLVFGYLTGRGQKHSSRLRGAFLSFVIHSRSRNWRLAASWASL